MDLPSLRHFENRGIFSINSDPVEALVGEAWVPAIYTDRGWATADGANLLADVQEWRNTTEQDEAPQIIRPVRGYRVRQVKKL
jgi:hypothetical protein